MANMLAHEKLQVYGKAVQVPAQAFTLCSGWDKRHALVDHLCRASESVVVNLAEAARLQGSRVRLSTIDYAIGSSLECAACFDLAQIKQLLTPGQSYEEKLRLCEINDLCFIKGGLNAQGVNTTGKELLDRITAMLTRTSGGKVTDKVTDKDAKLYTPLKRRIPSHPSKGGEGEAAGPSLFTR